MKILSAIYLWTIFRKEVIRIRSPKPDLYSGSSRRTRTGFALALRLFAHFPRLFPRVGDFVARLLGVE